MNLLVLSFISTFKSVAIMTLLARAVSQVIGSIGRDRRGANSAFGAFPRDARIFYRVHYVATSLFCRFQPRRRRVRRFRRSSLSGSQ